jgi:hypothetical protein
MTRGMALPTVLVVLAAITTVAASVFVYGTRRYENAAFEGQEIQERYGLQAGLARLLYAALTPGDPLFEALHRGDTVPFSFQEGGQERVYKLSFEIESHKADLNAAEPDVLRQVLFSAFGSDEGEALVNRILAGRRDQAWNAPEDVFLLVERFSPKAKVFHRLTTVYTGQKTLGATERLIYTLQATSPNGRTLRRVVLLDPLQRKWVFVE